MGTCPFDILYKYYPPKQWDYVFKDNTIRFTPPPDLNDPFEGALQVKYLYSDEYLRDEFNKIVDRIELDVYNDLIIAEPYEYFKRKAVKLREHNLEFVKNFFETHKNMVIRKLYIITNTYGILSLSECNDNILMWSHYCMSHTGFLVGLDMHHDFFQDIDKYGILDKVEYAHELSNETVIDIDNTLDLFMKKYDLWKYENEWRVVISLLNYNKYEWIEGAALGVTHLPVDAIKSVTFGVNMKNKEGYYSFLKNDPRYAHLEVFDTILDSSSVALKIIPFAETL